MAISIERPYIEAEYSPIYDPFTDGFQADPFGAYRRLREEAPVYYNEKWGFYALSRFDDVRTALKDADSYLNYQGVDIDDFEQEQSGYPGMLPNLDNPRHDALRAVVQRSFMPRTIKALTEEVRRVCDRLIDNFIGKREIDLSADYAWPIPFEVFYNFFGMPHGPIREQFVEWTHGIKDRAPGAPELTERARNSSRELREYLAELLRERRRNPQDDVLTRIVQAEIDGAPLTPEEFDYAAEAVGVAFALYLGGVETTAGQISTLLEQLARHPEQLRALQKNPELIPLAVEESLRFRTIFQVTARTTSRDVVVRGVRIPEGKRVFLIMGAANLDETKFENAEAFDIHRPPAPHLGFGEGLHGCLGNPLARLEATVALEQIVARLGAFTLSAEPERYTTTPNAFVWERVPVRLAREVAPMPVAHAEQAGGAEQGLDCAGRRQRGIADPSVVANTRRVETPESPRDSTLTVTVAERIDAAEGVVLLTLAAPEGEQLPPWQPGAHIDVLLAGGLERQYSLCSDPADRTRYRIGVLREDDGRGGSAQLHREATVGAQLRIRAPRNHFQLHDAPKYLFIAGGIGITPIRAMVEEAEHQGKDWHLVYTGRSEATMALCEELRSYGGRVDIWPKETRGRLNLREVLGNPASDTKVFFCGPDRLREAVEDVCSELWPAGALHLERFTPKQYDEAGNVAFEIVLARRGYRLTVPKEKSVLDVLEGAGAHVLSSCGEGTCGTCDTPVLSGEVEHRDTVLTPGEQAANNCMMVCVSRSLGNTLVLDL